MNQTVIVPFFVGTIKSLNMIYVNDHNDVYNQITGSYAHLLCKKYLLYVIDCSALNFLNGITGTHGMIG